MKGLSRLIVIMILSAIALAQSDTVAPNENLVAEGIPKVPASLAESVGRYSDFRYGVFASWHPVRREMLVETRFGDTNPSTATPSCSSKTSAEQSSFSCIFTI